MKAILDRTENRTAYIIVEPDAPELETCIEKVYQRLVKRVDIPGFARGSAPRDALEEHVGREQVLEEAIKELAHTTSSGIIKEHNIENWLQPMITILQYEPPKYEIAVALKPVVEIADYRSLKVEPESLEVSDEEVDAILEKQRIQLGVLDPVDRPVKKGDLIVVDIEGSVSGKPFFSKKNLKFHVDATFAPEMPGLAEKMAGAEKDEEFGFKLALPKDYSDRALAGREADFTVIVRDIRELSLDEINDDFAKKVAPGVPSLDELKKRIRYNLKKDKEQSADTKFKEKIVDLLIEKSHLEYPTMMIDLQARQLMEDYKQQLKSAAKDDKEYKEKMNRISMDLLSESARSLAKKRVLWALVLDEVAKAEGIEVSHEEVAEEIDGMTQDMDEVKQKEARRRLHTYERENVTDLIRVRKTVNRLAEIVTGKKQTAPAN
jgi:trigger factor